MMVLSKLFLSNLIILTSYALLLDFSSNMLLAVTFFHNCGQPVINVNENCDMILQ